MQNSPFVKKNSYPYNKPKNNFATTLLLDKTSSISSKSNSLMNAVMNKSKKNNQNKNFDDNTISRGDVNISNCTLNQFVLDFEGNKNRIKLAINNAKKLNSTILLLPELVTSGYSCEDHFYEYETYMLSMDIIREICNDPNLTKDIMVVLGVPVIHEGVKYNTMFFISNNKINLIRPKKLLADDGNYREARWFTAWSKNELEKFPLKGFTNGQTECDIGVGIVNCNGVKIAAEICEELWVPESMNIPLYLNNVDIILNSSGSHFELNKIVKRRNLINAATKRSGGAYCYSNLQGCDGARLYFDGGSMIGLNGKIIQEQTRFTLDEVMVTNTIISLDDITSYRLKGSSIQTQSSKVKAIPVINANINLKMSKSELNSSMQNMNIQGNIITNNLKSDKLILTNPELTPRKESIKQNKSVTNQYFNLLTIGDDLVTDNEIVEISNAASCWLCDYLRRSGASGFMIPLSGGADSASVALLVYLMCEKIEKYLNNCVALGIQNNIVWFYKKFINGTQVLSAQEICKKVLYSVYLPVKNKSTGETLDRSKNLAQGIGANWKNINISGLYEQAKEIMNKLFTEPEYSNSNVNQGTKFQNKTLLESTIKNFRESKKDLTYRKGTQNIEAISRTKNGEQTKSKNWTKKQGMAYSLADENVQARIRMVVNYLLSQIVTNGEGFTLTLGCSNSDEVLIGYYTKYDASSADLNPIGTLPKVYVNKILQYYAVKFSNNLIGQTLFDVWSAVPTAELQEQRVQNGKVVQAQSDEDEIGITYKEVFILGKIRNEGNGLIGMLKEALKNKYFRETYRNSDGTVNKREIGYRVEKFYDRYIKNRNKTTILTPSVHLLPSPDDNRFDLRPFLYPADRSVQFKYMDKLIS
jgi:NAD+ synthase (glutamine-hydrolysing)